jgi:hypothetical protein
MNCCSECSKADNKIVLIGNKLVQSVAPGRFSVKRSFQYGKQKTWSLLAFWVCLLCEKAVLSMEGHRIILNKFRTNYIPDFSEI